MDIALIIPCYNQAEYLQQLLSDLENQTDKGFYVVLIDDGSTDNTLDVCREFQIKSGMAVDVLTNDKNRGLSAARNYGLDFVLNTRPYVKYIGFIDSDDLISYQYVEALHKAIEYTKLPIAMCGFTRVESLFSHTDHIDTVSVSTVGIEDAYSELPRNHNPKYNINPVWGKLISVDLLRTLRFPENLRTGEEYYFSWRVLFDVYNPQNPNNLYGEKLAEPHDTFSSIALVKHPLYYYRENPKGLSKSEWSENKWYTILSLEQSAKYFEKCGYTRAYIRNIITQRSLLTRWIEEFEHKETLDSKQAIWLSAIKEKLESLDS